MNLRLKKLPHIIITIFLSNLIKHHSASRYNYDCGVCRCKFSRRTGTTAYCHEKKLYSLEDIPLSALPSNTSQLYLQVSFELFQIFYFSFIFVEEFTDNNATQIPIEIPEHPQKSARKPTIFFLVFIFIFCVIRNDHLAIFSNFLT